MMFSTTFNRGSGLLGAAVLACGFLTLSVLPGSAQSATTGNAGAQSAASRGNGQGGLPAANAGLDEIQRFCTNIADQARDQRYLLQKQDLEKLQTEVNDRIKTLEARKAEYQDWLARRNEFMQRAESNVIDIYKNMKPDAAGPQLEKINPMLAAAIIMKLPAKQSSLILSEMAPDKVATIAGIMASAANPNTSKDPS
ncbi:MotE family protein [Rhizobium sp.]|jgi:flagellar motility protein MotE (MotC chaperone)|uniref:MotE family protein n=1 Tax=Rhizobium sp. TaxID=391 RepID=UPI000E9A3D4B|nr:flagellar protein [Rhizobium sp.]